MGGGARALVRQPKTAGFFCKNRRNHPGASVVMWPTFLSTCAKNTKGQGSLHLVDG